MPAIGLPTIDRSVARAEPEGILNMGFSLFATAEKILRHPDIRVSVGEISVDRQRSFAFGNALCGPVGVGLNAAQA